MAVDLGLEQLVHGKLLHIPLILLIELRGGVHILQDVLIQDRPGAVVQIVTVGKVEQHLLGQQVAIVLGQGIQIVFIQPGQADPLFQSQLIPAKILPSPALAFDHHAADPFQDRLFWMLLIQEYQQTVDPFLVMLLLPCQLGGLQGQLLVHDLFPGGKVQHTDLKIIQLIQGLGVLLKDLEGLQIQKWAPKPLLVKLPHIGQQGKGSRTGLFIQLQTDEG